MASGGAWGGTWACPGVGVVGARAGGGTCLPPQEDEAAAAAAGVAGRTEPTGLGGGHCGLRSRRLSQRPGSARAPRGGHSGRGPGHAPRRPRATLGARGRPFVRGGRSCAAPRALRAGPRRAGNRVETRRAARRRGPSVFVQSCPGPPHAAEAGKLGRGWLSGVHPLPHEGQARGSGGRSHCSPTLRAGGGGRATWRGRRMRGPRAPGPRLGRPLNETLRSLGQGCGGRPRGTQLCGGGVATPERGYRGVPSPGRGPAGR